MRWPTRWSRPRVVVDTRHTVAGNRLVVGNRLVGNRLVGNRPVGNRLLVVGSRLRAVVRNRVRAVRNRLRMEVDSWAAVGSSALPLLSTLETSLETS